MTVQLDQNSRCLTQLEEEKKNTDQSLKRTQGLLDDLKGKTDGEVTEIVLSFVPTIYSSHECFVKYVNCTFSFPISS